MIFILFFSSSTNFLVFFFPFGFLFFLALATVRRRVPVAVVVRQRARLGPRGPRNPGVVQPASPAGGTLPPRPCVVGERTVWGARPIELRPRLAGSRALGRGAGRRGRRGGGAGQACGGTQLADTVYTLV